MTPTDLLTHLALARPDPATLPGTEADHGKWFTGRTNKAFDRCFVTQWVTWRITK